MQYDSDYEVRLATLGAMGGNTGVTYDSVYEIDLEILRLTELGGGGGGTGTSIDDSVIAANKTWSSSKINSQLSGKQATLTAGEGISINNNVISATGGGGGGVDIDDSTTSLTKTWSSNKISGELDGKQNTLTAGTNVTIQDGVISATDTTYTAGSNISIENGEISANLTGYATSDDLNNGLSFKQNTLTAGTGIEIVNDVISSPSEIDDINASTGTTYSSNKIIELTQGLGFDVEIVQALPQTGDAQTIYMLPKADSAATDVYEEYIYTNNAWEKIGNTQTDLSQYYTKSETDTLMAGKQATLTAGTGIQIVDNVISATGGGGGTELSAGTNISIVANKINANGYSYNSTKQSFTVGQSATAATALSTSNCIAIGQSASAGTSQYTSGMIAIGKESKAVASESVVIGYKSSNGSNDSQSVKILDEFYSRKGYGTYLKGVGGYTGGSYSGNNKTLSDVINSKVGSTSVATIWTGSQADYDAIATKDPNTLYIIN